MYPGRQRSNWWFVLPIFMGIIGGIIAYFVLRCDDPVKAKNCMYLGLILAAVGIGLNLLLASQVGYELDESIGFDINS